jgi:hypothetical protein
MAGITGDPRLGLAVGAIGLIATLIGVYLTVRANRESSRNLREQQEKIVRGVAELIASGQLGLSQAPRGIGRDRPTSATAAPEAPRRLTRDPAPKVRSDPLRRQAKPGDYAGTADLSRDGGSDLLVEQVSSGHTNLKIFAWKDFDLVLLTELANRTGVHFVATDAQPAGIATVDVRDDELREVRTTLTEDGASEELHPVPSDVSGFLAVPDWVT